MGTGRTCASIAAAIAGLGAAGPGGLAISPARATVPARAGEITSQRFGFTNSGPAAVRLSLQEQDAWFNEKGGLTFVDPGQSPRGLGKWLFPPPAQLVVPGGESVSFKAMVQVPRDASPGSYFGGFLVREVGEAPKRSPARGTGAAVTVSVAVGILLQVDVLPPGKSALEPAIAVVDARVRPPSAGKPLSITVELSNPSAVAARPAGTLAVFDASGAAVGKASFEQALLWPGQRRWYQATMALPFAPGVYRSLAVFEVGELPLVSQALTFRVSPAPAPRGR